LISVSEARARVLADLQPTGPEIVALAQAWGRVTAAPVLARVTQPPNAMSAMDGFAVRAAEAGQGATLRIVGAAPAGHPWSGRLGPGEALRIFTGSVMPEGSDAVLIQEDARRDGDRIVVAEAAAVARHIRRAGQDFAAGDVLLPAGRRLSARDVGLAAAGNHAWVAVHRRPRVAILATGDEIALPGDPVGAGGIVSSNTHMLAAVVRAAGGEPCLLPIAPDDRAALATALRAAADFDLLLTSGGASVGEHDLVREALQSAGMALHFWQVAMRPGKPLMHGRRQGRPVIGLPGNPVSSMVTGLLFALPAIERLGGLPGDPPPTQLATLAEPVRANDARADHLRAILRLDADGTLHATPFATQDSGQLRLLARADALVLRPPHAPALAAGAVVPMIRLDMLGL
jgi:molybdopterin molybdotransferase